MPTIAEFSRLLSQLVPALGSANYCRLLVDTIRSLVPVDEASIIVYESANLPVFDFADPEPSAQPNLEIFLKGAFLLDPFYVAATKKNRSGFFRLSDLAPVGFHRSEYYRIYYGRSGLHDECGYLIPTRGKGFINIALGRISAGAFSKTELLLLEDISSLIAVLCRMHWQAKEHLDKTDTNLRGQLEAALSSFGTSILTNRERQVINLVLHGHTTKKLADVLKISPETVKLHRKHAYAKLDVGTQTELFYLFIDSLKSIDEYDSGDPLIAYSQILHKNAASQR